MTENPFKPGVPKLSEDSQGRRISAADIFWHAVRFAFACFIFVVAPVFIVPELQKMLEEFGIELSSLTQFLFARSELMAKTMFLSVPPVVGILLLIESGLFLIPESRGKRLASVLWSVSILLAFAFFLVAMLSPISRVIFSLSA